MNVVSGPLGRGALKSLKTKRHIGRAACVCKLSLTGLFVAVSSKLSL